MNRSKVFRWMKDNKDNYRDRQTGELNHTKLAEEAACALDLYLDDGFSIDDSVFDLAAELD